ncbi:MAG TPA: type II secretion system protein [Patescibacteria group bacterium]|nr:type II secretion system protein [Patescibacteria group bacterium]
MNYSPTIKRRIKRMSNKKGFTLVELLIVLAIVCILAAVALPAVKNKLNSMSTTTDVVVVVPEDQRP